MKIAFVDWSNYPYGGDTTYCKEFKVRSEELGHVVDLFYYEKNRKSLDFEVKENTQFKIPFISFSKLDIDNLFEKLSGYDFVCFVQTPTFANFAREEREYILEKFKSLPTKTGLQNHVFGEMQTTFTCFMLDYIAASDVLITREDDKLVPSTYFGEMLGKTIIPLTLYSDLDVYVDETPKSKKLLYRGRFDNHKRPQMMGQLAIEIMKLDPTFKFDMMGIDATIGSYALIHAQDWANTYRKPDYTDGIVNVEGPFKFEDGIDRMKGSMFGYSPRTKLSGSYLEYAQIEVLQSGGILILSKIEGENSVAPDGRRWIDIPNFAVWYDESDPAKAAAEIVLISQREDLQEKYRSAPKEIMKDSLSLSALEDHLKLIEDAKNNRCSIEDLLKESGWNEIMIDKFMEVHSKYMTCPFVEHIANNPKILVYVKKKRKAQPFATLPADAPILI